MNSNDILIIKTGASGDVIRTSVLLHLFYNDRIYWVTAKSNIALLPENQKNLVDVLAIEDIDKSYVYNKDFDLCISLDDEFKCADLASNIKSKRIFGAYTKDNKVTYSEDAREWFDMGLCSKLGKTNADNLKFHNQCSYQEILFRMLGHSFKGEEYVMPIAPPSHKIVKIIGIEKRAGGRWPSKKWNQYDQLASMLSALGYETVFFTEKKDILDYLKDISRINLFISGDTLGMHVALGLKIPCVTIFTCTSPTEIYDYNRMYKLVSPFLHQAFYRKEYLPNVINSITLEEVLYAVLHLIKNRK